MTSNTQPAVDTDQTTDSTIDLDTAEAPAAALAIDAALLQRIVEGALLAAGKPLAVADLAELFDLHERPSADALRAALAAIAEQCAGRGFELREVASGFRLQVVQEAAPWIARLWEEKPQKYSRALLETLALIAYRQPITRGDIEDIRGVAVASNIVKTLLEREWVRVVGHKDVPGRPAMYATTRKFLDYFNLKNLDDLPALTEIRDLDSFNTELALEGADTLLLDESGAPVEITETEADAVESGEVDAAEAVTAEGETAPAVDAAAEDAAAVDAAAEITAEIAAAEPEFDQASDDQEDDMSDRTPD